MKSPNPNQARHDGAASAWGLAPRDVLQASDGWGQPQGGGGGAPPPFDPSGGGGGGGGGGFGGPPAGGGGFGGGGGGGSYQSPDTGPFLSIKALLIMVIVAVLVQVFMSTSSTALTPLMLDNPDMLAIVGIVGTSICVCLMLFDLLVGFGYAFIKSKGGGVNIGQGAAGGAIAAAVSRLLSGGVNTIISLALLPLFLDGVSPGGMGAGVAGGIAGSIIGVCMWTFIGAALGAIGGVIGGALLNK